MHEKITFEIKLTLLELKVFLDYCQTRDELISGYEIAHKKIENQLKFLYLQQQQPENLRPFRFYVQLSKYQGPPSVYELVDGVTGTICNWGFNESILTELCKMLNHSPLKELLKD